MEGYGEGPGLGGSEESMWQLGQEMEMYPERPNEANCKYYLRTGFCGYGPRCRFNHPPDRSSVVGAMRLSGGEYPQRVGQPVCKHYMMMGMCKFGPSCKYHHPRRDGARVSLNYLGFPLRPGEKECSYYIKTSHCKFGVTCKFHHPQPIDLPVTTTASIGPAPGMYPQVQAASSISGVPGNWQVARPPTMLPYPYMQGAYTPVILPHGMVPMPGWGTFPEHVFHASATPRSVYGITQLSSSAPEYTRPYSSASILNGPSSSNQKNRGLPERPGQPECQHYMKTGYCKYGSSCKYHHPQELMPLKTSESVNLLNSLGSAPCGYYERYGVCKYGSGCKYGHSFRAETLSYSPSVSSLTDMPVAPLPVGSSTGTLAASSSSSELHQELAAVSMKESSPTPPAQQSAGTSSSKEPHSSS